MCLSLCTVDRWRGYSLQGRAVALGMLQMHGLQHTIASQQVHTERRSCLVFNLFRQLIRRQMLCLSWRDCCPNRIRSALVTVLSAMIIVLVVFADPYNTFTRFVTFKDRKWHASCFKCTVCQTNLENSGFLVDGPDLLCHDCAKKKIIGDSADWIDTPVEGTVVPVVRYLLFPVINIENYIYLT